MAQKPAAVGRGRFAAQHGARLHRHAAPTEASHLLDDLHAVVYAGM